MCVCVCVCVCVCACVSVCGCVRKGRALQHKDEVHKCLAMPWLPPSVLCVCVCVCQDRENPLDNVLLYSMRRAGSVEMLDHSGDEEETRSGNKASRKSH